MSIEIFNTCPTLMKFIEFQDKYGEETFCETFYLLPNSDKSFNDYYSEAIKPPNKSKEFSDHIIIFANSDGTGGRYAFWLQDNLNDLENSPIISFSTEEISGCVIANNLKDLIKMLSYGGEGLYGLESHVFFDHSEEEYFNLFLQRNYNFLTFRSWMKETLDIQPVNNWKSEFSEEVRHISEKSNKFDKDFDSWQSQFYSI